MFCFPGNSQYWRNPHDYLGQPLFPVRFDTNFDSFLSVCNVKEHAPVPHRLPFLLEV